MNIIIYKNKSFLRFFLVLAPLVDLLLKILKILQLKKKLLYSKKYIFFKKLLYLTKKKNQFLFF